MSSFLYDLARKCFDLGWKVLAVWLIILLAAAGLGLGIGKGTNNAITIPGVESTKALDDLARIFPAAAGTTAQTVFSLPHNVTVDDPGVKAAVDKAVKQQKSVPQVVEVLSPYDDMAHGLITADRHSAVIIGQYEVADTEVSKDSRDGLKAARDQLEADLPAGSTVMVGGDAFSNRVPSPSATEALGVILAFVFLYVLFRSITTAFIPLATALVGVGLTEMLIEAATAGMDIMATAPMLALMIGLAVGIDYALFIVSRYKDELLDGRSCEQAAAVATGTAGSAVIFAGVTVIIALLGLFVAHMPFLTIMGVAAALGVAVAVCVAVTAIPALLRYLGDRPVRRQRRKDAKKEHSNKAKHEGGFSLGRWWVTFVTKHPVSTLFVGLIFVGMLAWPAQSLQLSLPGNASEPVGNESRDTYDFISEKFGEGFNGPLVVTVNLLDSKDPVGDMNRLGEDLGKVEGVDSVLMSTPEPSGTIGFVQIIPTSAVDSPETTDLVHRLRDQAGWVEQKYPFDDYSVTGMNAVAVDVSEKLGDAILPFGIFVVGLSLALLIMVFRSITVPIKAAAGYVLSLAAALGATTFVFVEGHGANLFGIARTGSVVSFMPIILMAVLFGLAMDYEVFLVSRIAEARSRGEEPVPAIRKGFVQSAPVVTTAAVIMLGVFISFVPDPDATIKPIAFALTVGVAVDAFIVRMTLVPAVLALLGKRAWGLPSWLEHRLPVFDVEGAALEHQLGLAHWPGEETEEIVSASDVVIRDSAGNELATLDELHVSPGHLAILSGETGEFLLQLLAGRRSNATGDIKVDGFVLPQQARQLRRKVPVHTSANSSIDQRGGLVIIENLDDVLLSRPEAVGEIAELLEANHTVLSNARAASMAKDRLGEKVNDAHNRIQIIAPATAEVLQ